MNNNNQQQQMLQAEVAPLAGVEELTTAWDVDRRIVLDSGDRLVAVRFSNFTSDPNDDNDAAVAAAVATGFGDDGSAARGKASGKDQNEDEEENGESGVGEDSNRHSSSRRHHHRHHRQRGGTSGDRVDDSSGDSEEEHFDDSPERRRRRREGESAEGRRHHHHHRHSHRHGQHKNHRHSSSHSRRRHRDGDDSAEGGDGASDNLRRAPAGPSQHYLDTQRMDDVLRRLAPKVRKYCVFYTVDTTRVPDFNALYELGHDRDPFALMFFYRNEHIRVDVGTGNHNKINFFAFEDPLDLVPVIDAAYRAGVMGRTMTSSSKKFIDASVYH